MSSWERARYVPWNRMPTQVGVPNFDLDEEKERIFRELQKEAIEMQQQQQLLLQQQHQQEHFSDATNSSIQHEQDASSSEEVTATTTTTANKKVIVPYSHMDLARNAAFGATLGSVTGCMFGFMDSMKNIGENKVLMKTSNAAKIRYLFQGTTRTGVLFGAFFTTYQVIKYGIKISWNDPGDVQEITLATPLSLSMFYFLPTYRPAIPYAFMLIGMDCFSLYMRKTS